jgi:hypothetical protein
MDTIVIVFEFCNPRDLLSIASTSQELSKRVTYTHVLRSSFMRGGPFCKASLEGIFNRCRKGAIFIPSPIRLLHLVNTRRCESHGCLTKVKSVNSFLGLSFCSKCTKKSYNLPNFEARYSLEALESVNKIRITSKCGA